MKNSPEIVRASLLPFFAHAADDLNDVIVDLQNSKVSNLKGTSQKGVANLTYVHMVLLPTLAAMLDHLGVNKYGSAVLVGEIQLACYKILNALWILGSCGTKLIDREWIVDELTRHRPVIGECLRSFASCFPIAFLESQFNVNNQYSIMYGLAGSNLSEHSLEGQDVMNKLSKNLPPLEKLINDLKELSETGGRHEEAPHIIDVLLPMICSYLNYWWYYGPSAKQQQLEKQKQKAKLEKTQSVDPASGKGTTATPPPTNHATPNKSDAAQTNAVVDEKITDVTSDLMNEVLGYILKIIYNNIEEAEAPWMNRIASKP